MHIPGGSAFSFFSFFSLSLSFSFSLSFFIGERHYLLIRFSSPRAISAAKPAVMRINVANNTRAGHAEHGGAERSSARARVE